MKHYLLVPYDKKDELKEKYLIKWDTDKKLWYFLGEDIPVELKLFKLYYIAVSFDDKDIYKKKYKSMKWDAIEKQWCCNGQDYERIMTKS
jgi:hypothetical protein